MKGSFSEKLLAWHSANARELPWRGENDPYRIWISEIMLQQTTVAVVKDYYARFLAAYNDVFRLAEAPVEDVLKLWEGLGYYSRARNLHKTAGIIARTMNGHFPDSAAELMKLPGIGPYTAGAIASMAFGEPVPALDGNLIRVLSRITCEEGCISDTSTKKRLYRACLSLMDETQSGEFNQALMGLGRLICLPLKPDCTVCPVAGECRARTLGMTDILPIMPPRTEKKPERLGVALVFCKDGVLVRQRPEKGLLAGLWEFPNFPDACDAQSLKVCLEELSVFVSKGTFLGNRRHVFTHLVWNMEGFAFTGKTGTACDLKPVNKETLIRLAMPTAMRFWREAAIRRMDV